MKETKSKQEESVRIQKAIEAFLQNGGHIERLNPIRAYGFFNMDIWKERIEPDLILHEVEREAKAQHQKANQQATSTTIKERIHPWRVFKQ